MNSLDDITLSIIGSVEQRLRNGTITASMKDYNDDCMLHFPYNYFLTFTYMKQIYTTWGTIVCRYTCKDDLRKIRKMYP